MRSFRPVLLAALLCTGLLTQAAMAQPAADKDPIRTVLLESKEKSRGVVIHANGSAINVVVVQVDDHFVIGRSTTSSRIVVRMDRIDGVSANF
ncbi:MAG TPA: hypothetical protein VLJ57_23820 [Burkholderiaceae bacterium]|nr:hypothetical protein [Burkholderiaceae bacterium]